MKKYYLNLFSPETHKNFTNSDQNISGFSKTQKKIAQKIHPGDIFICYVTKVSRWAGLLEIVSECFEDDAPIFYEKNDPFVIRFKVKPIVWLDLEKSIPIHDEMIWNRLSFTKEHTKNSSSWTGKLRSSLNRLNNEDAVFLEKQLLEQNQRNEKYPLTEEDIKKIRVHKVKTQNNKEISVSVPEDEQIEEKEDNKKELSKNIRESISIQAKLAEIGSRMGLKIWIPRSDRSRVAEVWKDKEKVILDSLPLNYDETTLSTIEQIDVLWIRGRSILRAFEVEHTTSIYSGILRMADLMALQPNLNIKAHIVAPDDRKDKVIQEINRPVFTLLEKGPLSESCTYIPYTAIYELEKEKFIEHMTDSVVEEYSEYSEV